MGYETQLLVGRVTDLIHDDHKYFMVYATIDMCKLRHDSKLFDLYPFLGEEDTTVPVQWFAPTGDGDVAIREDRYGDRPRAIPLKDVIEALEKEIKVDDYRRLKWALGLLKAMDDGTEELHVLQWGH